MRIYREKSLLLSYSFDATGMRGSPKGVIIAEDEKQIVEAVKYAIATRTPLIPRGGGTGFVGGAVPPEGSIVISLEKLDRIIDVDEKNLFVEVEAGVITGRLQEFLENIGYFYPPDPSSLSSCTIGGNIATNAGGPRALKYGVTKNYVYGIRVVLGNGIIYDDRRKVRKKAVGYNLKELFIGSEGSLGIITRAILKILKKPEKRKLFLCLFHSMEECTEKIPELVGEFQNISALELMDTASIEAVRKYRDLNIPNWCEATLIVEIDGYEKLVEEESRRFKNKLKGMAEIVESEDENRVWAVRRAISPAIMEIAPYKINEDITVPIGKLKEAFLVLRKLSQKYKIPIIAFGHAGDGNIHVNVMLDDMDEKSLTKAKELVFEIFRETVKLGGVLSGEHGIGVTKKKYLPLQVDEDVLLLWKNVKKIFDPEGILSPHIIFSSR